MKRDREAGKTEREERQRGREDRQRGKRDREAGKTDREGREIERQGRQTERDERQTKREDRQKDRQTKREDRETEKTDREGRQRDRPYNEGKHTQFFWPCFFSWISVGAGWRPTPTCSGYRWFSVPTPVRKKMSHETAARAYIATCTRINVPFALRRPV